MVKGNKSESIGACALIPRNQGSSIKLASLRKHQLVSSQMHQLVFSVFLYRTDLVLLRKHQLDLLQN